MLFLILTNPLTLVRIQIKPTIFQDQDFSTKKPNILLKCILKELQYLNLEQTLTTGGVQVDQVEFTFDVKVTRPSDVELVKKSGNID